MNRSAKIKEIESLTEEKKRLQDSLGSINQAKQMRSRIKSIDRRIQELQEEVNANPTKRNKAADASGEDVEKEEGNENQSV